MHIMIDLETMGTRPDAPIIAIGAVSFDVDTDWVWRTFYVNIDLQSAVSAGAKIDPSTVMWWMKQSDEARRLLPPANPWASPRHLTNSTSGSLWSAGEKTPWI